MPRSEPLRTHPASLNFDTDCHVCGGPVQVREGKVQPHRCRIDLDAQRVTTAVKGYRCGCTEEAIVPGCAVHHTLAPKVTNLDELAALLPDRRKP